MVIWQRGKGMTQGTSRAAMLAAGGVAGFCLWWLTDALSDLLANDLPASLAIVFIWVLAGSLVIYSGRLGARQVAIAALGGAILATALTAIALLRHETPESYFSLGYGIIAVIFLTIGSAPFVVAGLKGEGWPAPYRVLYAELMSGIIRVLIALAATGLIWAVFGLSAWFLSIVGIDVLKDLADETWFGFTLTGALLGVTILISAEITESDPPVVLLRLARLLVPFVLAVVLVFIVALPLNGFDRTFGMLSAASVLISVGFVVVSLVSLSVSNGTEEDAHRIIALCTRILAATGPIGGALALWAVLIRVGQYGWTPSRLGAATLAVMTLVFGIGQGLALLSGADWQHKVRQSNRVALLVTLAIAGAWLLPIVRPEAVSANSQVKRLVAEDAQLDYQTIWALGNEWGKAGTRGLQDLKTAMADDPSKVDQIDGYADAETVWAARMSGAGDQRAQLAGIIPAYPATVDVAAALGELPTPYLDDLRRGCDIKLAGGGPACVLVEADISSLQDGPEHVFIYASGTTVQSVALSSSGQLFYPSLIKELPSDAVERISDLQRGIGVGAPVTMPAIRIGEGAWIAD